MKSGRTIDYLQVKGDVMVSLKNTLICLTVISAPAIAQEPTSLPPASALPAAPPAPASAAPADGKIVMYRPGAMMGFGVACPIRYKGQELVELGRNRYAEWRVPAGRYILTNKTASVEVSVAPGEARYVRCQIKTGFMSGRADLQIVDYESFAEHQAEFEAKQVNAPPF